jgi:DNA repair exonuclease SbcCD nuclease subunit
LLCLHQAVEGAVVGLADYTFKWGPDVIQARNIPKEFTAVLSGHIHRSQVLTHDLNHFPLPAPVIYPGSVERTAFAERFEEKHYAIVEIDVRDDTPRPVVKTTFIPLPARQMITLEINASGRTEADLVLDLGDRLRAIDPDAVVSVQVHGSRQVENDQNWLTSAMLRELAPPTMNVSLRYQETESRAISR